MIYQQKTGTIIVATPGTAGTTTEVLSAGGQLGNIVVSVPALEGTGTATIRGVSSLSGTIYSSTSINESATGVLNPIGTPTFFVGTLTLVAVTTNGTDGTQSADRSILYDMYYQAKQG